MNYWKECIAEAFEDAGIQATEEQISTVACWVEGAHENHDTSHGYNVIPNPLQTEIDGLKKQLYEEQNKDHSKKERERADNWRQYAKRLEHKVDDLRTELSK